MQQESVNEQLAIQDLLYRHGLSLDSLDIDSWMDCFTPVYMTPEGAKAAMEYHQKYAYTMHNVTNHHFSIQGAEARGATYCVAAMVREEDGKLIKRDIYLMYRDELKKVDGSWRFANRQLEILFSSAPMVVERGAPFLGMSFLPGSLREQPALGALKQP